MIIYENGNEKNKTGITKFIWLKIDFKTKTVVWEDGDVVGGD